MKAYGPLDFTYRSRQYYESYSKYYITLKEPNFQRFTSKNVVAPLKTPLFDKFGVKIGQLFTAKSGLLRN